MLHPQSGFYAGPEIVPAYTHRHMQVNQSFVISLGSVGGRGATLFTALEVNPCHPIISLQSPVLTLATSHLHPRSAYFYHLCDCTKVYFSLPCAASSSAALNTGGSGFAAVQSVLLIAVKEIPSLQKISKGLLEEYHPDGG